MPVLGVSSLTLRPLPFGVAGVFFVSVGRAPEFGNAVR